MNPSHYPDLERSKKLTELGFPKTELVFSSSIRGNEIMTQAESEGIKQMAKFIRHPEPIHYVFPSVMEMMDVLPEGFAINADNNDLPNRIASIIIGLVGDRKIPLFK